MVFRALTLLAGLVITAPASAQCTGANLIAAMLPEERAALDAAVAAHPYPEGNFWRARKGGQTVHVRGTIHIPDPRLGPVAADLRAIVSDADLLILEATSGMNSEIRRVMAERPELAFLTEGPTLIDLLGEEDWSRLAADLAARGIPPFVAAKFRPWLLGMTLAIPNCALRMLAGGQLGLDARLEAIARETETPIATLDDVDTLLGLLAGGSLDQEVDMLRLMLHVDQDQTAAMATTIDSYFAGRHRELWEFSRHLALRSGLDASVFDAAEAALLDARNNDWAAKLPALIEGKDAVIAVGAAHLSGETGILRALERMGYGLTRL